jgi:hypothetical protein
MRRRETPGKQKIGSSTNISDTLWRCGKKDWGNSKPSIRNEEEAEDG